MSPPALPPFANEPILELRRAAAREDLAEALRVLDDSLPLEVPVLVGGDRGGTSGIESTDPGAPERLVASAGVAGAGEVEAAVEAGTRARGQWAAMPAAERAAILVRAAELLRADRLELAALEVRECAKPWPEADADVCEAIDFLEYYARGAIELERGPELLQPAGERNDMRYVPRGVVAVISPWNFPLAIPTGMTAAALAAGNSVVLKPAEQSPACSLRLVDALHRAGVPRDALALLPGLGETGAALVRHPGVHGIAFTGSSPVGLEIIRAAAEPSPRGHVKRVVAEMGGKNCAIVDADADLDEVVLDVVRSAFAYAGQKCSACSRVLADKLVCERLEERLAGAIATLAVGQAGEFGTDVPPVIERDAAERVDRYRADAAEAGRLVAAGERPGSSGWFCPPALVADLPADAPVLREEVFGPLLSLEPVAGVEEACDRVDALPFALTGAVFSRNPATVAMVAGRSPVGNLYVNRHTTGAMVGRQPFGGNRLSGIGAKAGGPDYLVQFTEPRVVTENTMRHGLIVE